MNGKTLMKVAVLGTLIVVMSAGCGGEGDGTALVQIKNDFDNPAIDVQPPWTICRSSYLGVAFGTIGIGETSETREVVPGLDHVLMVGAWDDPTCAPERCLPLASRNEEEVVDGQTRIVSINMPNHQGPCPPEGVQPVSRELYERILQLWPEYDFKPYDQRLENPKCLD